MRSDNGKNKVRARQAIVSNSGCNEIQQVGSYEFGEGVWYFDVWPPTRLAQDPGSSCKKHGSFLHHRCGAALTVVVPHRSRQYLDRIVWTSRSTLLMYYVPSHVVTYRPFWHKIQEGSVGVDVRVK